MLCIVTIDLSLLKLIFYTIVSVILKLIKKLQMKQNKEKLKSYFETGDIPTQEQYGDLIDSYIDSKQDEGTDNRRFVINTLGEVSVAEEQVVPEYTLSDIVANKLSLLKDGTVVKEIDLTSYIDDTNLARLISGSVDANGIATFSRDDRSTFQVDFSNILNTKVKSDWNETDKTKPSYIENKPANLITRDILPVMQGGKNISIDNSNPLKPVVNSSGASIEGIESKGTLAERNNEVIIGNKALGGYASISYTKGNLLYGNNKFVGGFNIVLGSDDVFDEMMLNVSAYKGENPAVTYFANLANSIIYRKTGPHAGRYAFEYDFANGFKLKKETGEKGKPQTYLEAVLKSNLLTENHEYQLPNKSITFAGLDDTKDGLRFQKYENGKGSTQGAIDIVPLNNVYQTGNLSVDLEPILLFPAINYAQSEFVIDATIHNLNAVPVDVKVKFRMSGDVSKNTSVSNFLTATVVSSENKDISVQTGVLDKNSKKNFGVKFISQGFLDKARMVVNKISVNLLSGALLSPNNYEELYENTGFGVTQGGVFTTQREVTGEGILPIAKPNGVQAIVAGTNISIDNSNPAKPVINASSINTKDFVPFTGATKDLDLGTHAIKLAKEEVVPNKAKHQISLINTANQPILRIQTNYWNGSSFKSTLGTGMGLFAMQQNTGLNSSAFGALALINNTGRESTGVGYESLRNNTGSRSNGVGNEALKNNTGANSNGFGYKALESNTGGNSSGFGEQALRFNTGEQCSGVGSDVLGNNTGGSSNGFGRASLRFNRGNNNNGFGSFSLRYNFGSNCSGFGTNTMEINIGSNCVAFGDSSLRYNQGHNNSAFGFQSGKQFLEESALTKTIANNASDIDTSKKRIKLENHGFGSDNQYVNLRYKSNGEEITGLKNNSVYRVLIVDANIIELSFNIVASTGGAAVHTFTPQKVFNNTTVLGANAQSTKSNQVVLGDVGVEEVTTYGDYVSTKPSKGLVLKTPDGTKQYRISIDNSGNIISTLI